MKMTIDMKNFILFLVIMLSVSISEASEKEFNKDSASNFEKKLVEKARTVSMTLGPDFNVDGAKKIVIEGPITFEDYDEREEVQKYVGQLYYEVTFCPEETSCPKYNYISKVDIWSDMTPQGVIYSGGFGFNFFFCSFEELKESNKIMKKK